MDFTSLKYSELVLALKDAGYEFVTYAEYAEGRRAERLVVMRHDVDKRVLCAMNMAREERRMNVKASYYLREDMVLYGKHVIKFFAERGHEVGYHYEELVKERGNVDKAYARFVRNIEEMRQVVDVRTITMHGSPMSKIDSKQIWRVYDYRNLGIVAEPQMDVDWNDMFYLTDTGRSWSGVNRRDRVAERTLAWKAEGWVYKTTDDVIRAIKEDRFPQSVMITTHPQRWSDSLWEWMWELVMQKVKNVVKWVLLKK